MNARLKTAIWVQAYIRRLQIAGIPAFLTARGDDTAGAVMVKLNTLDGRATVYQRVAAGDGAGGWQVLCDCEDREADAVLARQRQYDPDLWVVEVEDRDGRHMLEAAGLERG